MSNKTLAGGAILLVVGLLIFAKIYTGHSVSGSNPYPQGSASVVGVFPKNLAPDFTLQKLGGSTLTLSEWRGKKPVVVDFWASWCPNCRRDMPNLNLYYEKYKDRVEVVGVNLQENEGTVQDFISSRGITFPIAFDPSGQASSAFGIQYTNTHFLIDKDGNLERTIPGDIREEDIISLIGQKP